MKRFRFLTVTRRVFRDIVNDRRTLALIVIAPIFAMFIFGLAFSGQVEDVRVAVANLDRGAAPAGGDPVSVSERIISNLDDKVLNLGWVEGEEAALQEVEDGAAFAALVFPEGFTQEVLSRARDPRAGGSAKIEVFLDKSNINVAESIVKTLNEALSKTMDQFGQKPAIAVDTVAAYGKDAKFMDFFVPGIMAFVVYLITTLLTLISFVGERTSGTLERMLATTLTERDVVLGYGVTFSIVGIGQALLLLIIGVLVFDITIVGNVLLAFVGIALLAVVSQALGILLSSTAKREAQVMQVLPFVILPAFLLAGIFWPVEAIPSWLRPLSYVVPPTYTADACREVMLKGSGIGQVWIDLVVLLGMALFFLALSVWSLRLRKE